MQASEDPVVSNAPKHREKETSSLIRIASLLAILWAAVLLLSSIALLVPRARMNTYHVPTPLIAALAIPGLLLLAGGIGSRLGNKLAMGGTIILSVILTVLSIMQFSKGIPIALVGAVLNACIAALLITHLTRKS